MKVLITGSEGNVGQILSNYLKSKGHEVYGIDIKQKFEAGFLTCDINETSDVGPVFEYFKPDAVIHLAAMVSRVTCEASPALTIKTNISGTQKIAELCYLYKCKLLNFSTSEVYGNIDGELDESREDLCPNNVYGLSKLLAESVVRYYSFLGLEAITIRPFMLYHETETLGAHRSAMIRFVERLLIHEQITVHKGSGRSWLHIDDAVVIIENLLFAEGYRTINIGHPEFYYTYTLAMKICDQLGMDYEVYAREIEQPAQMTLLKQPSLKLQYELAKYKPLINLEEGISRVVNEVRKKLAK